MSETKQSSGEASDRRLQLDDETKCLVPELRTPDAPIEGFCREAASGTSLLSNISNLSSATTHTTVTTHSTATTASANAGGTSNGHRSMVRSDSSPAASSRRLSALSLTSIDTNSVESRIDCSACKMAVYDSDLIEAMSKYFHVNCFRCSACNDLLPAAFYEESGRAYCKSDYTRLFGQKCHTCHRSITGLVMSAGEQYQYHPECFLCTVCASPIGESDRYTLIEGTVLICGTCSDMPQQDNNQWVKSKTIVQLVHIPADNSSDDLFKLSAQPANFTSPLRRKRTKRVLVESVRETEHTVPVRPGDIIIEVNGNHVRDHTPEQIQDQLRSCQGNGYTLTLERKLFRKSKGGGGSLTGRSRGLSEKLASVLSVRKPTKQTGAARLRTSPLRVSIKRHQRKTTVPPTLPVASEHSEDDARLKSIKIVRHSLERTRSSESETKSMLPKLGVKKATSLTPAQLEKEKSESLPSSLHGRSGISSPHSAPGEVHWVRRTFKADKNLSMYALHSNSSSHSFPSAVGLPGPPQLQRCFSGEDLSEAVARSPRLRTKWRRVSGCAEHHSRTIVFRPSDLEFGEIIGRGFFGQVLRVTDRSTGTVMVMKELLRFDNEAQRNFLKEVSLLKSLDHPNVMHFIGIMYRNKMLHLITEYVGGGTLADRLQNKDIDLSWSLRISFASDIATGMDYLHRNKIIHRDLTSNNCLIRLDDTVVVGDFGLAHQAKNRISTSSSRLCTAVGSAYWMAPEMMKGLTYDHRADVFSFGIILCEIIGRVSADPDFLPRTLPDFGLDEEAFRRDLLGSCPERLFEVALVCCCTNPLNRPSFHPICLYLSALCNSFQFQLVFNQTFNGFHSYHDKRRHGSLSRLSFKSA